MHMPDIGRQRLNWLGKKGYAHVDSSYAEVSMRP